MDAYQAGKERAGLPATTDSDGTFSTNLVPKALWWRADKYDLVAHKSYIVDDLASNYADTTKITASTWVDWLNDNWDGEDSVTNSPAYTEAEIISQAGLATNYFDHTPWRSLHSAPTGWLGIKDAYELLTTAFELHPYSGTSYTYEGTGTSTLSWNDAKANADANVTATTGSVTTIEGLPYNYTTGSYDGSEWTAGRYFAKVEVDASQTDTNLASETIWIMLTDKPFEGNSKIYDNNGKGLVEDEFAQYGDTYVHTAGDEYNIVWGVDSVGESVVWCADPEDEGTSTSRGYEIKMSLFGYSEFIWMFTDFAVTNGFDYVSE